MSGRSGREWRRNLVWAALLLMAVTGPAAGKEKPRPSKSLAEYLRMVQQPRERGVPVSAGSLWSDQGGFSDLARDYKAAHVGDLVTILVSQNVQAQNSGNVSTDRSFKASSGIDGLAGHISTTGVQNIFSPSSSQTLQGKAQSTSSSSLTTRLTGRVVAILDSGSLVVEATREVTMNNENQTILVRGLVRPGDLGPDNTVLSNSLGDLELELKGKGIVSDGTRPPNAVMRWLLRLVGF